MSLVVAAHNGSEIVIASDSLSTSTKTGVWAPDSAIQKVRQIHSRLAFAVTGRYVSDKHPFFTNYVASIPDQTDLDAALDTLYDTAVATMRIHKTEGFRMSLIGFNGSEPGFRCVDVVDGKGFTGLGERTRNHWLSGEYDPVEHAIAMIEKSDIESKLSVEAIETTLRVVVADCIERYPQTLGLPVNVLVLR